MNLNATFSLILSILILTASLTACSGRGGSTLSEEVDAYEAALVRFPGSTAAIDEGLARFQSSFFDLTADDIGKQMRETYAEILYFNDTLHSFDALDGLVEYMERTGESLDQSRVDIHHVIRDGADVYVRWSMEFHTRAAGSKVHSRSIGMTHLRFNASGRVVLHQDFWDSGHALYAHLPGVGFAVRRARSAL